MFAGLKNKIKEETGSDPTKLVSPAQKVVTPTNRGRHSRQGSGSSVGSISLDGAREELVSSPTYLKGQNSLELKLPDGKVVGSKDAKRLERREEEWRRRLAQRDEEWGRRLDKKEEEFQIQLQEQKEEWKTTLEVLEREKSVLEEEKLEIVKQKLALEEALRASDEYKKKVFQYQEDLDQLEGFQTQEMAKIKHLLLVKEQEVAERVNTLKESSSQIEQLKSEVNRLRRYEEEYSNLQEDMETLRHSSGRERSQLASTLAQSEEEVRHLRDRVAVLERRTSGECAGLGAQLTVDERVQSLLGERTLLERRLEEAHLHLTDIKGSWSEKISQLETQVGRLSRQAGEEGVERRRAEGERSALLERVKALEVIVERGRSAARDKEELLLRVRAERDALADELKEVRGTHDAQMEELQRQIASVTQERNQYNTRLEELDAECAQITVALEAERSLCSSLCSEKSQLERELESERTRANNLVQDLERECGEKDATLVRNAQVNQQVELVRQELRAQQGEVSELNQRIHALQSQLDERQNELERIRKEREELATRVGVLQVIEHDKEAASAMEGRLRANLLDMEEQLSEKHKHIRVLQQRLGDMKKTLQRELKAGGDSGDYEAGVAILTPSSSKTITNNHNSSNTSSSEDDVNFKYLKHVLIKFLTSREYEAQHLTRAVATLLRFSPEEERLLRETLDWKMSWFGSRPRLGAGQTAKAIPPS